MTQSSIQSPVTIHELLISSLAQTDVLAKLLIEKGSLTEKSSCEDFRLTGDVSEVIESNSAMNFRHNDYLKFV